MNRIGDILRIDLSTGACERTPYDEVTARRVLGGRGFGIDELQREAGAAADPLSPENPLVLAPGLLVGSGAPSASRVQLTARSPLTGFLGSSNVGGDFGFALRAAGLSALVLRGRAPRLSALWIVDGRVEVRAAADLRGLETDAAQAALAERAPGGRGEALVIGPAGERLLPLACVVGRRGHVAGRTGLGAVLGSKNLKGIVAAGDSESATPPREDLASLAREYVRADRRGAQLRRVRDVRQHHRRRVGQPAGSAGDAQLRDRQFAAGARRRQRRHPPVHAAALRVSSLPGQVQGRRARRRGRGRPPRAAAGLRAHRRPRPQARHRRPCGRRAAAQPLRRPGARLDLRGQRHRLRHRRVRTRHHQRARDRRAGASLGRRRGGR